jgi:3-oxoacyl-[acyl-carrier-protein] synthase II
VITGLGVISPIGIGREQFWEGLRRGKSAVREITRFDPAPFKSRIAAQVDDFHPHDHLEERRARRLDRFSQFSIAASRLALEDAELDLARENLDRMGAMMGTALGGVAEAEAQHQNYMKGGVREVDPRWHSRCSPGPPAATWPSSSAVPDPTPPTA